MQWQIHTRGRGDRSRKTTRKIFSNLSENKSSNRKLSLILFATSAYYEFYPSGEVPVWHRNRPS